VWTNSIPKVTRDECKAHQKDQQKAVGMTDEDQKGLETSTEFLALISYPVQTEKDYHAAQEARFKVIEKTLTKAGAPIDALADKALARGCRDTRGQGPAQCEVCPGRSGAGPKRPDR